MKYVAPTGSVDLNAPYTGKNPGLGQQGSKVPPAAIEHPQREIVAVIANAGLTPSEGDLDQLDEAIGLKIAAGGVADVSTFKVVTSSPSVSPPGSPASGDEVLVADSATGAFSGHDRKLARWNGTAWSFSTVRVGRIFRINDTDDYYKLAAGGWTAHTFPSGTHTHDDRYFTEGEADGRFVQLAPAGGAAQSISGSLAANGLSVAADASAGLTIGRYSAGYAGSLLAIGGTFLSVQFGGVEKLRLTDTGNLGIGTSPPTEKLDVAGNIKASGGVTFSGPLTVGTDAGTSTKVLTGNASGAPLWKTLAELGMGKKIIAIGMVVGTSSAVVFATAEPDTAYSAAVLAFTPGGVDYTAGGGDNATSYAAAIAPGYVDAKTTAGCTVHGYPTSTGIPHVFYIIYR